MESNNQSFSSAAAAAAAATGTNYHTTPFRIDSYCTITNTITHLQSTTIYDRITTIQHNKQTTTNKQQEATKIPKEYLTLIGSFILLSLIFFGIGAGSVCSIIGFLYPAYKSLLAIESKTRGDDTQWLIYWVVYCFFSMIEVFTDFLLYWIPFYYAFKLAFLLWAMLPQTKGAKFLYDSFLKDFLKKNESKIDQAIDDAKRTAGSIGKEVIGVAGEGIGAASLLAKKMSSVSDDDSDDVFKDVLEKKDE
jgi:receptor expression-enhancing protein 5/6